MHHEAAVRWAMDVSKFPKISLMGPSIGAILAGTRSLTLVDGDRTLAAIDPRRMTELQRTNDSPDWAGVEQIMTYVDFEQFCLLEVDCHKGLASGV